MSYKCEFCGTIIPNEYPNLIHAGFSNLGFMYCNKCPNLLVWESYDKIYSTFIGDKHPWTLSEEEKKKVEDNAIQCECGGKFQFDAKLRCPECNNEIPGILPSSIEFIELKNVIQGDIDGNIRGGKGIIWRKR
jgi:hypothetical protein